MTRFPEKCIWCKICLLLHLPSELLKLKKICAMLWWAWVHMYHELFLSVFKLIFKYLFEVIGIKFQYIYSFHKKKFNRNRLVRYGHVSKPIMAPTPTASLLDRIASFQVFRIYNLVLAYNSRPEIFSELLNWGEFKEIVLPYNNFFSLYWYTMMHGQQNIK
jgi:hypothetical protein